MIRVFIGYDAREAVAYHALVQSIMDNASDFVAITPINLSHMRRDASNDFVYSRFLVPYIMDYKGWAIYLDSDMVFMQDIAELWDLKDEKYAVQVVKHEYRTKYPVKYLGNKNEDYPRKNWSSMILWNCKHKSNRKLTAPKVHSSDGSYLHRFQWLQDSEIGELPKEWNWLAMEYPENERANLVHYTIGTPCFKQYANCEMSHHWRYYYHQMMQGVGS